jgi:2-C-methyl-D-erythritol 4-phosphate cytidylyltransferase
MATISLIIAGAGASSRFGGKVGKTYLLIGGEPVFLWTLDRFKDFTEITQRLLVVSPQDMSMVRGQWGLELEKRNTQLVAGGKRRFDSVKAALAVVDDSVDLVAVHDAARPTVGPESIAAAFAKAAENGAAIVAQQVNQTLKRTEQDGCLSHVANRGEYWLAQTPQVFARELLVRAYEAWPSDGDEPTDDAQVVEAVGQKVWAVPGGAGNIKITTEKDLKVVEAILLAGK